MKGEVQYLDPIENIFGKEYREVHAALNDLDAKAQKNLIEIIKSNIYLFGLIGREEVPKSRKNAVEYGYSFFRNKAKIDIYRNGPINVFLHGPKAEYICKEILKLVPKKEIQTLDILVSE